MVGATPTGTSRSRRDISLNPAIHKRDKSVSAARSAVREKIASVITQSQAPTRPSLAFLPSRVRDQENIPPASLPQPVATAQRASALIKEKNTLSLEMIQVYFPIASI